MNILDFAVQKSEGPILEDIFVATSKLFFERYKSYQPTVKDLDIPLDIDTFDGQVAMKDYLEIRVVEELIEMREAIKNGDMIEHVYEEISDSLGFLINAYILYGWTANKFKPIEELWFKHIPFIKEDINEGIGTIKNDLLVLEVIYDIGRACNKLKIRPWKKSQYLTDILIWEERLEKIFYSYIEMVFNMDISPKMLWSIFNRKVQCNEFRLDTNY